MPFGLLWGALGLAWAPFGVPFGDGGLEEGWEAHKRSSTANSRRKWLFGTRRGSHGSHGSRGNGVKNCGSEPPPTRAGGQDDGS